jgi:acetoin utilization deacetylase AcuC-like enzyme
MSVTALIAHEDCALHEMSPGHPEQPARMRAVLDQLGTSGLLQKLDRYEAREATRDHLLLAHPADYVDRVFESAPGATGGMVQLDADTAMNAHSLRAALLAAGAGIQAVDLVTGGTHESAFCCVRPPGHHAERAEAMGFCLFGSIAIAALYALQQAGVEKVAIIDFDVHHGNGTEDLVGDDERIFFCSSFQYPLYPGKYGKNVPGRKINIPLTGGSDGAEFRQQMQSECLPALSAFEPDLILISAGFDAHAEDPLGGLNLMEADFTWITQELKRVAGEHADGRIVSMLEGGYNLDALGRSAAAHVNALLS